MKCVLIALLLAAGCAKLGSPVIAERSPVLGAAPEQHLVRTGETLWAIAYRYQLDVETLARANGLAPPYTIYPGQQLRLRSAVVAPLPAPPRSPARTNVPKAPPPNVPAAESPTWRWPVPGRVIREFGPTNPGLDFEMTAGHVVRAAAGGEVVYAGNGLGGYRRLVIVRHDREYLSAYSVNGEVRVREGDRPVPGDVIADPGEIVRGAAALHFEIRRMGAPVNPRTLLGGRQ